uniref:1,4-dihydroxy-2-naphthoate octaprenyltransferase n=1 Tax=Succinivibrio sp. TaxID=2053619 RepID=UPI00402A6A50
MLKDWLSEIRLKSLLLALTNCALGCALGYYYGNVTAYTLFTGFLIVATGVLLQILSNFADDYGDACKSADGPNRLGPIRAVMLGSISLTALRKSMATVTLLATICGSLALFMSVGNNIEVLSWFVFLGVAAVLAAIFYTIGMAYGYKGFGDIAVFIFFGLAAVIGSQILVLGASDQGVALFPDSFLLGLACGAQSVMVLHVASMRDIVEDRLSGKKTIAARLGPKMSAVYLIVMFAFSAIVSLSACFFSHKFWECFIVLFALLPLAAATYRASIHCEDGQAVAKERKYTLIGCAFHNIVWMMLLTLDYWFYY